MTANLMKKFVLNAIKKWQFILYTSLMLGAVAFLVSTMITPKYRSDMTVLIVQKGADTLTASKNADYIGNIFKETLTAEPFLRGVLKTDSSIQREFSKDAKKREREWNNEIKYEMVEGSGIFKITVFDPNNEDSQKIAIGIVNHFKEASSDYFGEYGEMQEVEMKVIDGPITSSKVAHPNTILNTIFGFFVGFFGSLLIVYFYESFDLKVFGRQNSFKGETLEEDVIEQQVGQQLARQLKKRKDRVALEYLDENKNQVEFNLSEKDFIPEDEDEVLEFENKFDFENSKKKPSEFEELEYVSLPEEDLIDFKQRNQTEEVVINKKTVGEEIKQSIEQAKKAEKEENVDNASEIEDLEQVQEKDNFWENMRSIDRVSNIDKSEEEADINPLIKESLVDMETYHEIIQAGETFRGFKKIQEKGQIAGAKEFKEVIDKKDKYENNDSIESVKVEDLNNSNEEKEAEIEVEEEIKTEKTEKVEKKTEKTKESEVAKTPLELQKSDMFGLEKIEENKVKEIHNIENKDDLIVEEEEVKQEEAQQKEKAQIEESLEFSTLGLKKILKTQSPQISKGKPEELELKAKKIEEVEIAEIEKAEKPQEEIIKKTDSSIEKSLSIENEKEIQQVESMEFIGSLNETTQDKEVDTKDNASKEREKPEKIENLEKEDFSKETVKETEELKEIEAIVEKRKQEEKLELERVLAEESKELVKQIEDEQKTEELEAAKELARVEAQIQKIKDFEDANQKVDKERKDELKTESEEIESIEYLGDALPHEKENGEGGESDLDVEIQHASVEEPQKKNIFSRLYEKSMFNDEKIKEQREERTKHHLAMDPEELEMMRKMLEAEGKSTEEFVAENGLLMDDEDLMDKDVVSKEKVDSIDKQEVSEPRVEESVRKVESTERIGHGGKKGQAPAGLPVFIEQENEQDVFARQFLDEKDPIGKEKEKQAMQSLPDELSSEKGEDNSKKVIDPEKEASEEEIKERLNKLLQGEL